MIRNIRSGVLFLLVLSGIFLFIPEVALAQNNDPAMRVVKVEQAPSSEILRDDIDNYDDNGDLAAGLIIRSNVTNLTLQASNNIIRQQKTGSEIRILVSSTERFITAYAEGYPQPLEIVLPDEGVRLEAGKFWIIEIRGDAAGRDIPVFITPSEDDATVTIDDGDITGYTYGTPILLPEGEHYIEIEKVGYVTVYDTIDVNLQNVSFPYEMKRIERVNVSYITNPGGASIIVDGAPLPGTTIEGQPYNDIQPEGRRRIQIRAPGYIDLTREIDVRSGQPNRFTFDLQKNTGYVTVNSNTPGAALRVDNNLQDLNEVIELAPRPNLPYTITVRATGFDDFEEDVLISKAGDSVTVNANLGMVSGELIIRMTPNNAKWTVKKPDGTIVDSRTGTGSINEIQIGTYIVEAELTNFETKTERIEILRDEVENVTFNLRQIAGLASYRVNSVFEDAEVTLSRPGFKETYTNFPADIPSIPFGTYELTAKKDGFETFTTDIAIDQVESSITLMDQFRPKTKGKAFFRAVLPGAVFFGSGHRYLGKKGRGFLYFLGGAAAIGWSAKSLIDYKTEYELYKESLDNYNSASNLAAINQYKAEYQEHYENASVAEDNFRLGMTIYGAIKGLELLDVLLQASNKKKLREAKLKFNAGGNGISMTYNF